MTLPRRTGYAPSNTQPSTTTPSTYVHTSTINGTISVSESSAQAFASSVSSRTTATPGPSLLDVSTPTAYFPFLSEPHSTPKGSNSDSSMDTDADITQDGDENSTGEDEEDMGEMDPLASITDHSFEFPDNLMLNVSHNETWDANEVRAKQEEIRNHPMFAMMMRTFRKFHTNQALASSIAGEENNGESAIDFGLEEFLKAQEITLYPSNDPGSSSSGELNEFYLKLRCILDRYAAELAKLNRLCEEFSNRILQVLQDQGTTRVVSQAEVHLRLKCIKKQFDRVRTQLRQNVCSAILALQRQYGQEKKKRRTLSKSATDILNEWFFAHLHDPYPSDDEKMVLATRAGITLNQVNNWFGNKRIRHKRKCIDPSRNGIDGQQQPTNGADVWNRRKVSSARRRQTTTTKAK